VRPASAREPQCGAAASDSISNGISNEFNQIQIPSNFDRFKKDLPKLEKIEIKYGCEGFEERNNFLYRNLFGCEMDFE
jgi:hypothetical protein